MIAFVSYRSLRSITMPFTFHCRVSFENLLRKIILSGQSNTIARVLLMGLAYGGSCFANRFE